MEIYTIITLKNGEIISKFSVECGMRDEAIVHSIVYRNLANSIFYRLVYFLLPDSHFPGSYELKRSSNGQFE